MTGEDADINSTLDDNKTQKKTKFIIEIQEIENLQMSLLL